MVLQQLMDAQQTKGSASYHAWLTPTQFGQQFGPSDADVQAVTDWLTRQGFQVSKVAAGRTAIEFNGTAGQVRTAFHTEIHKYAMNGETHVANASEPAIPAALAPVVRGVTALNNFPRRAHLRNKGVYRLDRSSGQIKPLFTYGNPPFSSNNPANFAMTPADFATVYSIPAGADGTGQTIAVIGQSNIDANDVIAFRTLFGLPQNFAQTPNLAAHIGGVIVNGPDPGLQLATGDEGESDLDVEWAGAVAPNATILLVTSTSTLSNQNQVSAGIDLSAIYAVDNNLAAVISESYGACEPSLGAAGNQFYNALWEQAAAQGITVVVSAGDSGSAGCDPDPSGVSPDAAVDGLAVSGIASTPFNVAVGGTDFDPSAEPVTPPNQYWSATNGPTFASALTYIPETTWDDSACAFNYPSACNNVDTQFGTDLAAGSGGPSNCAIFSSSGNCSAGYPIPAYQVGVNKLFPTVRAIPDVSLFASNGGPLSPTPSSGVAVIICQADDPNNQNGASCSLSSPFADFSLVGGTSAATPPFGAIVALLNQASGGQRQGNVNYGLYSLAASDTTNYMAGKCNSSVGSTPAAGCVFNDVTKGNIGVACMKGSTSNVDGDTAWCQGIGSTFGVTVANNSVAYGAGPEYDVATGLGSVNVANLLTAWTTKFVRTATTTAISGATGGTPSGTNFSATVTVTPAAATGNVSLTALASDGVTALGSFGPFTLSGGTVTASTTLLPPGTAAITATYGGDATHAISTSTPPFTLATAVSGAGLASKTVLGWSSEGSNGSWSTPTTGNQNFPYGTPIGYILSIAVQAANGNPCGFSAPRTTPVTAVPCPTGTITLTSNGNPQKDFPNGPMNFATPTAKLNNNGLAEDQPINLNAGSYSIVATYAGDQNFGPSTSNTLSVTLTPVTTSTTVASSLGTITTPPATVTLSAAVATTSNGDAPCGTSDGGTVAFTAGGSPVTGTVTYTAIPPSSTTGASCTATISTSIASLLPPAVRAPRPTVPLIPILIALLSMVFFALGWRWMPERRRRTYAYAGFLAFALLAVGIAGCGGGSSSSKGTNVTIQATYSGNVNYKTSAGSTTIFVQ